MLEFDIEKYIVNKIDLPRNNKIKIAYNIIIEDFEGDRASAIDYFISLYNCLEEDDPDILDEVYNIHGKNKIDTFILNTVLNELDSRNITADLMDNPNEASLYTYKITLNKHKKNLYRTIMIPGIYMIKDLIAIILCSFYAEKGKVLGLKIDNALYTPEDADLPSVNVFMENSLIEIIPGPSLSDFVIVYLVDNEVWEFNVNLQEINNNLENKATFKLLSGKGYGILENNQDALNYLLSNKKSKCSDKVQEFIDNNPEFDIMSFSLKDCYDNMLDNYQTFENKMFYLLKDKN